MLIDPVICQGSFTWQFIPKKTKSVFFSICLVVFQSSEYKLEVSRLDTFFGDIHHIRVNEYELEDNIDWITECMARLFIHSRYVLRIVPESWIAMHAFIKRGRRYKNGCPNNHCLPVPNSRSQLFLWVSSKLIALVLCWDGLARYPILCFTVRFQGLSY